jgi:uncharacterized protein (DUF924 family)
MDFPTEDVLAFWFQDSRHDPEAATERHRFWFRGGSALDTIIQDRYTPVISEAAALVQTLNDQHEAPSALDLLAIIIALDQFPRHVFRGTSDAFSYASEAEAACRHLLSKPESSELTPIETIFSLTPFHHAEDLLLQNQAVSRIETLRNSASDAWQPVLTRFLRSFRDHALIVERFGRFPHRNALLNRSMTEQERSYLKERPQSFGQSFNRQREA